MCTSLCNSRKKLKVCDFPNYPRRNNLTDNCSQLTFLTSNLCLLKTSGPFNRSPCFLLPAGVRAGDHADGQCPATLLPQALLHGCNLLLRRRPGRPAVDGAAQATGRPGRPVGGAGTHPAHLRVRGPAQDGRRRGQPVPPVRGARPRAAGQGHRQFRQQGAAPAEQGSQE